MVLRMSNAFRNAGLKGFLDALDGAQVRLRAGAIPANGESAETGTLLATGAFGTPAFNDPGVEGTVDPPSQPATPGVAYATAIADDTSIDANGTIGYAAIDLEGGGIAMYVDVGIPGSGAFIEVDNGLGSLDVELGGTLTFSLGQMTMPAS